MANKIKVREYPRTIRLADGTVIVNPTPEQAQLAGYELFTPEELQQLEEQEQQRRQDALDRANAHYMEVLGLRAAYTAVVHAMCDLAGEPRVSKIEDGTGVEALQAHVAPEDRGAFIALALKLLYITVDLRRADGPDAWDRIPEELN